MTIETNGYFTTQQAGEILGIGAHQVRVLARQKQLGRQITRGVWLFTMADIKAMKNRADRGRPAKQ